jgi:hypothetical protein
MPLEETKGDKKQNQNFEDILELARFLSASTVPEKVIETVLNNLRERLGKRARCAFFEGEDLKLKFWAGEYPHPVEGLKIHKGSIVWDVIKRGVPVNLTDPHQTNGYIHTLLDPIKIKAIIPLGYVDPLTNENKQIGALIVDSGKEGTPISSEDFEYLQVIGQLIGAIIGRAQLIEQLMASCQRQEMILLETAHNFRNRIAVIGGLSRRIANALKGTEIAERASQLLKEVKTLEANLEIFEKYMSHQGA